MVAKKITDEQVATAIEEHGSQGAAAKALGMHKRTIERRVAQMRRKGWSPEHDFTHMVPDGYRLKGTSTPYGEDGQPKLQWVKSMPDEDRQREVMQAAFQAMADELPRYEPMQAPTETQDKLLNLYTLTDCHVGALAWHREGGADWDLSIQENVLVNCFQHMMTGSPDASHCVINQLGDFLHFDGLDAVTPTHGHLLDADGRFGKVVETAIRILRRVVDMALTKHKSVHVVMAEGNHDLASSVWLRKMFAAMYEREPRVTVDDSELPYYAHRHGSVMLAFHHGHLKKNESLPLFFASQYPLIWGPTTKRYCHTGHRHHLEVKEHSGMTVTQHPTLAARDAHASRNGYISERQALSMTYHADHGFVASTVVTPEMLG